MKLNIAEINSKININIISLAFLYKNCDRKIVNRNNTTDNDEKLFICRKNIYYSKCTGKNREDVVDIDTLEREIWCEREIRAPIVCFIALKRSSKMGPRLYQHFIQTNHPGCDHPGGNISCVYVCVCAYISESSRFWSFARKDTSSSFAPAWTLLLVNKPLFSLFHFPSPPGRAGFSCRVFLHRPHPG